MSTCMRPARTSAGTRRGRMKVSIAKPFFAPTSGSPGSLRYATAASVSASTQRTIVEVSTTGRIARLLSTCGRHSLWHRVAIYSGDDGPADASSQRRRAQPERHRGSRDRKSTRLNSSHGYISYAVFCLKKKKTITVLYVDTQYSVVL